jgi:hypothetical protein
MLRLINDVIKPWDELNDLLAQRFAHQPDLSDATRLASALAVAIKHQADHRGVSRNVIDAASGENRIMSDVADAAKHAKLRDPARNNKLDIAACFEWDGAGGFRFVRNAITIKHASAGDLDFMVVALGAIQCWMVHVGMTLTRNIVLKEGPAEFHPTAFLYYNPKYCVNMKQTRIQILKRLADGGYVPADAQVRVVIYEMGVVGPPRVAVTIRPPDRSSPPPTTAP